MVSKNGFRLTRFVKKKIDGEVYICCKIVGRCPGKTVTALKAACNAASEGILNPVEET